MRNCKKFHFLGVGGISMSALGRYLAQKGHTVSGSDVALKAPIEGVDTSKNREKQNILSADYVVTTAAISREDKALLFAKKHGKKVCSRGRLLGKIASSFKESIAISGTHGKTTTTEMIAEIFLAAGKNPTVHIGGISNKFNDNLLVGENNYFITEACEYAGSFLHLFPSVGVVLNVEPEHLDFFKNFEAEKKYFAQFAEQSKTVICHKNLGLHGAITFGTGGNYESKNVRKNKTGYSFDVMKTGNFFCRINLKSSNQKNIENALCAVAVANFFNIEKSFIQTALSNFAGIKRRMEIVEENPLVIHDYAHHPDEIENAILSVQKFYKRPVWVAFQPHTYSRTKALFGQFVSALSLAEKLWLLPTYPAREKPKEGLSAETLFNELKNQKFDVCFEKSFKKCKQKILAGLESFAEKTRPIVLILGAGDIDKMW